MDRKMSGQKTIWDLYAQWKALTEEEGAAIVKADWTEVRRCQEEKQQLQQQIVRAEGESAGGSLEAAKAHLRSMIEELISLEQRNNSALAERLAAVTAQRGELHRRSRTLKQVHQSYVPSSGPVWNSYS